MSNNSSSGTIDFPVTASFSALSIISLLLTATFRKFSKMDSIKNRSHVHTLFDLSPSKTASSSRFIHFACLQIMMLFALFTILFRKEINSQIKLKLEIFCSRRCCLPHLLFFCVAVWGNIRLGWESCSKYDYCAFGNDSIGHKSIYVGWIGN